MPLIGFLLGAALAPAPVPTDSHDCQTVNRNPATLTHLQVGPVPAAVNEGQSGKAASVGLTLAGGGGKVLGYTRIAARYRSCAGGPRDYQRERRDALRRFFAGKHAEKIVTVDLHVTPLDVKASKPILTIKRDSTSKGEGWSTDVVNDAILLPYFRVDRSSTIAIQTTVKSTRNYESQLAGGALNIVERASNLINPTTALITEANKQRFNDAATFVDGAINNLLNVTIEEKASSQQALHQPDREQILAILTISLPMANNTFATTALPAQILGQWEIYAEQYRPSMMVEDLIDGRIARGEAAPSTVLNYLVAKKKTIRESLAGSKSLASARDALVAAKDAEVADKARTLCRALVGETEALGLAPVDSGAVAWAYLADLALTEKKHAAAETGCFKIEFFPLPDS